MNKEQGTGYRVQGTGYRKEFDYKVTLCLLFGFRTLELSAWCSDLPSCTLLLKPCCALFAVPTLRGSLQQKLIPESELHYRARAVSEPCSCLRQADGPADDRCTRSGTYLLAAYGLEVCEYAGAAEHDGLSGRCAFELF
jgi:hypothetical protein